MSKTPLYLTQTMLFQQIISRANKKIVTKLQKDCILFSLKDTVEFASRCNNLKAQIIYEDMLTLEYSAILSA
jgi:hypothetical protein